MRIREVDLDVQREALVKPFGFKGGAFTEKWLCRTTLTSDSGKQSCGLGGLAVLWSDRGVFVAHTEVGGNLIMASVLEYALQAARDLSFESPLDLQEQLFDDVHAYATRICGGAEPSRTFTLNALVSLDNAAWVLYAREHGIVDFDGLIPEACRPALDRRHATVTAVPLISYGTEAEQIAQLVDGGAHVLKVKIGAPGDAAAMLERDRRRLDEVHRAVGPRRTSRTADRRVHYYLDANGRYQDLPQVEELLDHARTIGMFDQITILEEPFAEDSEIEVGGLGVRVAADESLHDVHDVAKKRDLGYGALALKPAGKTLSLTLRMAAAASSSGLPCFVADSACTPRLLDWNRNVAARLAPFPGLSGGLLETNGAQVYRDWDRLVTEHPCAGAPWLRPAGGVFDLPADFYARGGGILA